MKRRLQTRAERENSRQLTSLVGIFNTRGINIRREKLVRGSSFRAKSGSCRFEGRSVIFLDRRLSAVQQANVLTDYLVESDFMLNDEELALLEPATRALLDSRA